MAFHSGSRCPVENRPNTTRRPRRWRSSMLRNTPGGQHGTIMYVTLLIQIFLNFVGGKYFFVQIESASELIFSLIRVKRRNVSGGNIILASKSTTMQYNWGQNLVLLTVLTNTGWWCRVPTHVKEAGVNPSPWPHVCREWCELWVSHAAAAPASPSAEGAGLHPPLRWWHQRWKEKRFRFRKFPCSGVWPQWLPPKVIWSNIGGAWTHRDSSDPLLVSMVLLLCKWHVRNVCVTFVSEALCTAVSDWRQKDRN